MAKNNEPQVLSIARCKRLIRPLISKIHSLTDLHSKYPAKLVFDVERFGTDTEFRKVFVKPQTSHDRLLQLKPFLSSEAFEGYTEIFNIFKSIVLALKLENTNNARDLGSKTLNGSKQATNIGKSRRGPRPKGKSGTNSVKRFPSLTVLAAQKLGKSIALNTKSTHYSLNQTALFDPASIPLYLRKFHDQLADDIDEWLQMEPQSVFGQHRPEILLGYVLHLLVFNSRNLLYTLIPVICHWLHEQSLPNSRSLFIEYWLSSNIDPDHEDVQELAVPESSRDPTLTTFWLFHSIEYWQELVSLLGLKSIEYSSSNEYDALFIEALVSSNKLDLAQVDVHEIYALLRSNLQHPKNTQVLISIIAQYISQFRKRFQLASTSIAAQEAIDLCYADVREMVQAWLSLSKSCIFNSLDKGNDEIFKACSTIILHLRDKCTAVSDYLTNATGEASVVSAEINAINERFQRLRSKISKLHQTLLYLQAFFFDTSLSDANAGPVSKSTGRYFWDFVADSCDDETMEDFIEWVDSQEQTENTEQSGLVPILRQATSGHQY